MPSAGLRFRSERTTVILKYFPRLYLRYPNLANAARPLLFHRVGMLAARQLSQRVSWSLSSTVGQGDMDYTSPLVLTTNASGRPSPDPQDTASGVTAQPQGTQATQSSASTANQRQTVLSIRTLTASTSIGWQESQRSQLSLAIFISGTGAIPGGQSLPNGTAWLVGSSLTQGFLVTPRDNTGLPLTHQHGYVELTSDFDNVSAIWDWSHQYSVATQAGVYAGVGVIHADGQSLAWSPSGWINWQTSGTTQRGFRRSLMLSSGVRTFVNTFAGTAYPAAFIQGSMIYDLAPRWSFDALLSYQMPLTNGTSAASSQLVMSTGNWQFSFHRRIGQRQNFAVDFGLRGYFFSDSLAVSNPKILGTQTWAFVGFTWSDGTGRDETGSWVL